MWHIDFSELALKDIDACLSWTRDKFGSVQMRRYQVLIKSSIKEIRKDPNGPLIRRHPEIHPDARIIHLSRIGQPASHYLLFRFVNDETIEIGRLLHDRMELLEQLPDEYRG